MENILVVEDEAITAMDLSNRLTKIGYNVPGVAESGEEAISLAEETHPDLILMDIMLKGDIDGTVAASKILNKRKVPIIFLTAYNDEQTFSRAKISNPYGYLSKPINTRDLQIAIDLALYKHSLMQQTIKAEKRYRTLMNNATCGIIIYSKDGIILEANENAENIFGIPAGSMIKKDLRDYFENSDLNYLNIKIKQLLDKKHARINIGHIYQPNGVKRDVEITSAKIDTDCEELAFSIINDVTDQNRMREIVLLNDKLSTIGVLATSIIHEINNPLNMVFSNLSLLKAEHLLLDNPDTKQLIDQTLDGADKINHIVHNLKSFGRIDEGNVEPNNIHHVIESVINMAYPKFRNIANIEKIFDPSIPVLILNRSKLQQVLLNLIVNAGHSFSAKSEYKNNFIRVYTKFDGSNLTIRIEDTGSGISPYILPQIFDPFFTTKPAGIGTGLGLSISRDIVSAMGGKIDVESQLGSGSIFSVTIPVKITIPESEINTPTDYTTSNKKILIIDDDSTSLSVLRNMLSFDNDVTSAYSGREALNILASKQFDFDIIISDLNMPDVSGVDIYRFLAEKFPKAEDKMIFVTGGVYTENMNTFLEKIKNPTLEKPYTPKQLIDAIYKLINKIN